MNINCLSYLKGRCTHQAALWHGLAVAKCILDVEQSDPRIEVKCKLKTRREPEARQKQSDQPPPSQVPNSPNLVEELAGAGLQVSEWDGCD